MNCLSDILPTPFWYLLIKNKYDQFHTLKNFQKLNVPIVNVFDSNQTILFFFFLSTGAFVERER